MQTTGSAGRVKTWVAMVALCAATGAWGQEAAPVRGVPAASAPKPPAFLSAYDASLNLASTNAALKKAAREYVLGLCDNEQAPAPERGDAALFSARIYTDDRDYEKALQSYRKVFKYGVQPASLATTLKPAFGTMAAVGANIKDPPRVRAAFQQAMADGTWLTEDLRVSFAMAFAGYLKGIGSTNEAVAVLDQSLKDTPNATPAMRAAAVRARTEIYAERPADRAKARAGYEELIAMGESAGVPTLCWAYTACADTWAQEGNAGKSIELLHACIKLPSAPATLLYAPLAALLAQPMTDAQAAATFVLLRERIAGSIDTSMAEACQQTVVRLLLARRRNPEALQEARVLFYTTSDRTVQPAVDLVMAGLKAVDSNLGRVNRFLKFQKYGPAGEDGKPGTADDLDDVLRTVPPLQDPERARIFEGGLKGLPDDWAGWKKRGQLQFYLGRPDEAFKCYRRAFDLCPLTAAELQGVTDLLTGVVIRQTKDAAAARQLVQFLMFGSAGKDGKEGTEDDLADPCPAIVAKLKAAPEPTKP